MNTKNREEEWEADDARLRLGPRMVDIRIVDTIRLGPRLVYVINILVNAIRILVNAIRVLVAAIRVLVTEKIDNTSHTDLKYKSLYKIPYGN